MEIWTIEINVIRTWKGKKKHVTYVYEQNDLQGCIRIMNTFKEKSYEEIIEYHFSKGCRLI